MQNEAGECLLPVIEYLHPPCVVAGQNPVTVYIMLAFPPGVLPPALLAGWRLLAICDGDIISSFLVQPFAGDLVRCTLPTPTPAANHALPPASLRHLQASPMIGHGTSSHCFTLPHSPHRALTDTCSAPASGASCC